jgi:hypothetical protein
MFKRAGGRQLKEFEILSMKIKGLVTEQASTVVASDFRGTFVSQIN